MEGIYFKEPCRRQGIALALLRACEQWAREPELGELAADCALSHTASRLFPVKAGFKQVNRIIRFTKAL